MAQTAERTEAEDAANRSVAALEGIDIRKSLRLGRERIEILKGINLSVDRGEFVAIMGPSGSGKSTLLGIIAGLDNPTSGRVLIDGIDITRMSEGELAKVRNAKIGMVFQAFNLIPTLTARENVEIPLYAGKHRGSPAARATFWSCVAMMKVVPVASRILRTICSTFSLLRWSRLPVGSSMMTMAGSVASARATATRCCSPPESWLGRLRRR